ncbi:MAG: DUF2752 domain-containing protein [Dehalococcoidia bacterium]
MLRSLIQWAEASDPPILRWKLVLLTLAALPCLAYLYTRDPAEPGVFPPCPWLTLTGYHCPGCGTLRASHQLLNGHLLTAFGLNPLTLLSLPFVGYAFLSALVLASGGRRLPLISLPASWIWALPVMVVLFWVLRNLPVYPFTWLAP